MKHKYPIASPDEATRYLNMYRSSEKYDWAYRHRFTVVSHFLPCTNTSQKLLDFGCGNGSFIKFLSNKNYMLTTTGYDPYFISGEMNKVSGVHVHRSLENINKEQFDFVTAIEVIEHIEDDYEALVQIHKLLVPGGSLLLTVPAHQCLYSLYDAEIGHYRRYCRRSIVKLLKKTGLSIKYFTYFFFPLIPVAIVLKYYKPLRRMWQKEPHLDVPSCLINFFSVLTTIELKLLRKTNFNLPFGHNIFVHAKKEPH